MAWEEIQPKEQEDSVVWEPKEGDEIIGTLKDIRNNVGPNKSTLYTLLTDDGAIKVWGSAVLDSRLEGVELGTNIKILFKGVKKSEGSNRHYKDFGVYMDTSGPKTSSRPQNSPSGASDDIPVH